MLPLRTFVLLVALLVSYGSCAAPSNATTLDCDVPYADTLGALNVDTLALPGSGVEVLSITVVRVSGGPNFQPVWRIIDKRGIVIGSDFHDPGPHAARVPLGPPSFGPYQVQITDYSNDDEGGYRIHVQRLTSGEACDETVLACDVVGSAALESDVDTDLYSFNVGDGDGVSISVVANAGSNPGFNPVWRLLNAGGAAVVYAMGGHGAHRETGPLPSSGNPYRVEVGDGGADQAGTYRIRVQGLGVGTACDTVPLACDAVVTAVLDTLDSDLLTFTAQGGEFVSITVGAEGAFGPTFQPAWRLLDRAGNLVTSFQVGTNVRVGPLGTGGSPYRVEVVDSDADDAGEYRAHLQRLTAGHTCDETLAACDVVETVTLSSRFETNLHAFTVGQGDGVSISVVAEQPIAGFNPVWRLLDASGVPVVYGLGEHGAHRVTGPLPVSGNPYRVEVADGSTDQAGSYLVRVQGVGVGSACDTVPLSCDVIATGAIDHVIESDLLAFSAGGGEHVSVTVGRGNSGGPNFQPAWRVLDRSGYEVTGFQVATNVRVGPLGGGGSPYRIEVADSFGDDVGEYQVHLQRLTAGFSCDEDALACDIVLSDTLESRFDTDLHGFSVGHGDGVSITVVADVQAGAGFNPIWRLVNAAGLTVVYDWGQHGAHRLTGPLPTSGSPYRIEVADGDTDQTGRYVVRVQGLGVGTACDTMPLPCDEVVDGVIEHLLASDLLTFPASSGEYVSLTVGPGSPIGPSFQTAWRLLDRAGNDLTGFRSATNSILGPLATAGSPYRVEVMDSGDDDVGHYRVHLQRLSAGHACDELAIVCGGITPSGVADPFETSAFTMTVPNGQSVGILVTEGLGGPLFSPGWRLLDRSGAPVAGPCGTYAERGAMEGCGPLMASGNPYRIEVGDTGQDDTGSFSLEVRCGAGVGVRERSVSAETRLRNDPNPFRARTSIAFELPERTRVRLRIFDVSGRIVAQLANGAFEVGAHAVSWDALDLAGRPLESGIYVCEMSAGNKVSRRPMVLVR